MPIRRRDNFGRSMREATIHISKRLQNVADEAGVNVRLIVADELEKKYKDNVAASYTPRTQRGQDIVAYNKASGVGGHKKKLTYHHNRPSILIDGVYAKTDNNTVKIMIQDKLYPDGSSTKQVYDWLTKGTKGGDDPYPYMSPDGIRWSKNYPTPAHLFEMHTMLQMKGFLDGLESRIKNKDKAIFTYRYTGKKKPRKFYRGEEVARRG